MNLWKSYIKWSFWLLSFIPEIFVMAVRNGGGRLNRQVRNILRSNSWHNRKRRINICGLLRLFIMGPYNLMDLGKPWLRTSLYQGKGQWWMTASTVLTLTLGNLFNLLILSFLFYKWNDRARKFWLSLTDVKFYIYCDYLRQSTMGSVRFTVSCVIRNVSMPCILETFPWEWLHMFCLACRPVCRE